MTTQIKRRRGDTYDHSSWIGAEAEITIDTDKETVVVHDGSTAGGFPLLRAEGGAQDISTTGDVSAADGTFTGDVSAVDGTFTGNATLTGDLTINTDALFVDASAKNVSIGKASPTDTNSFTRALDISGPSGSAIYLRTNASTTNYGLVGNDGTNFHLRNQADGPIYFATDAATTMVLDSSGSLLIGGTLPASPATTITAAGAADFAGSVKANAVSTGSAVYADASSDASSWCLNARNNSGSSVAWITSAGAATFTGNVNTGPVLTVTGTEGISASLYLIADDGDDNGDGWRLNSNQDANDLTFANNTSGSYVDKLTITSAGAATFTSDLQVNGNPTGGVAQGVKLQDSGYIECCNSSGTYSVFKGFLKDTGTPTSEILASGAATFANNVTSQVGDQYSVLSYAGFTQTDSNGGTVGSITPAGNATFTGALSKGSGSFKISHPLPEKTETHNLVHSFIEGPQADLIYSGMVTLVAGKAEINLDTAARMTEGTFLLLNTNLRRFVSNEGGWTAVKSSITGNVLTVEAQDDTCTDEVFWTVIGERKDQHMLDTEWTDENGRVITEPLKPVVEEEES